MKIYNLQNRTYHYAKEVRDYSCKLQLTLSNTIYIKQLLRSSSSIGANYIEANENLGNKDFIMRLKICLKEAKESIYWLKLIKNPPHLQTNNNILIQEALELIRIFSSIISNKRK
jgi:four helix bundle protein